MLNNKIDSQAGFTSVTGLQSKIEFHKCLFQNAKHKCQQQMCALNIILYFFGRYWKNTGKLPTQKNGTQFCKTKTF